MGDEFGFPYSACYIRDPSALTHEVSSQTIALLNGTQVLSTHKGSSSSFDGSTKTPSFSIMATMLCSADEKLAFQYYMRAAMAGLEILS